jgi:hypothetical protein
VADSLYQYYTLHCLLPEAESSGQPSDCLFICCLFNDAVSSSDYIAPNDGKINEEGIGNDTKQ